MNKSYVQAQINVQSSSIDSCVLFLSGWVLSSCQHDLKLHRQEFFYIHVLHQFSTEGYGAETFPGFPLSIVGGRRDNLGGACDILRYKIIKKLECSVNDWGYIGFEYTRSDEQSTCGAPKHIVRINVHELPLDISNGKQRWVAFLDLCCIWAVWNKLYQHHFHIILRAWRALTRRLGFFYSSFFCCGSRSWHQQQQKIYCRRQCHVILQQEIKRVLCRSTHHRPVALTVPRSDGANRPQNGIR